jgi:hypothetical protein
MRKIGIILIILLLLGSGYLAFYLGWILIKAFIGLAVLAIFAFGVVIGRLFK